MLRMLYIYPKTPTRAQRELGMMATSKEMKRLVRGATHVNMQCIVESEGTRVA